VPLLAAAFCAQSRADALDWLDSRAGADGSYATAADPATPFQATAEALRAFSDSAATTRAGIPAARAFLLTNPVQHTEYLARRILLEPAAADTPARLTELHARQHLQPPFADGGFGDAADTPSTVIDTAFALQALAARGQTAVAGPAFALDFLLGRQGSDGGWSDGANLSSVYLTALVMRAMQPYRDRYALDDVLDRAAQFLLAQRDADGRIGTTAETALALLALAPQLYDTRLYQDTVAALRVAQAADGSWEGSVYTTALAVRALLAVSSATPPDPALATVKGVITDAVDGTPLEGAGVTLSGAGDRVTTTAADGSYRIENVPPGAITLRVEQAGYLAISGTKTATAGQRLDFSAALPRDPQPQSLTLTGRVVDAAGRDALAGVTLRVVGSGAVTQSTNEGRFVLAGLAAGNYRVEVEAAGFITTRLAVAAAAGGTLDVGVIALNRVAGKVSAIAGTVTDALTRAPLRGVTVTINGADSATLYSTADGSFEQRPVQPGSLTVNASLDGYRSAGITATLAAGGELVVTIALVRAGNPAEVSVQGRLVDAVTAVPLEGATVSAASGPTQRTDADGNFLLGGIPAGAFTLQFRRSGYLAVAYQVSAPAGGSVQMGIVQLAPDKPVTDNRPPGITSRPPGQSPAGQLYAYDVLAEDADGDPLRFALLDAPAGMQIEAANGRVRWIPTVAQTGVVSFSVVVADDRGGVARQDITVQVSSGGSRSYVVTDTQTLNGLAINATVPQNYVLGRYVSGAVPDATFSSPPCPLSFTRSGSTVPAAIGALDRLAIQPAPGNDIVMDLEQAYDSVAVFPQIDHLPVPQEGIEYTVWGANDPAAPFPDGWAPATLVSIYTRGWEVDASCNGADETDDYAGLYSFAQRAFRYLRVRADFSVTLFDTPAQDSWQTLGDEAGQPGWQSGEGEIDAVGGMQCAVKPVVDAGADILGVTGDTITFDAGASRGSNLRFGWDLDGDHSIDLTGAAPQKIFTAGFDGDVTLYAVDERGCVGTDQLRVTIGLDLPRPDLVIEALVTDALLTDPFTLQVTGSVGVTVHNQGRAPALIAAQLSLFEDLNANGSFDPDRDRLLGALTLPGGLRRDEQVTLQIPLSGEVAFRDSPLLVMVDSDQQIEEQREDNNLASTVTQCRITPPGAGPLSPQIKWQWDGSPAFPDQGNILGPVMVGQLSDDNGDGLIDQRDTPDLVFAAGLADNRSPRTVLVALSGDTGQELWVRNDVNAPHTASVALGDIDSDGVVEIVMAGKDRTELIALENDGTVKWRVPSGPRYTSNWVADALSIADLDHDGSAEILQGNRVYNSDGSLRWTGNGDRGAPWGDWGYLSIAADVDLKGDMEVIAGRTLYDSSGAIIWHRSDIGADGLNAVGNFDADDFAEIVLVANGRVYVLNHDGSTLWGPVALPGGGKGGPPTVADFDGDGEAEIGVAGGSFYTVFETDGRIKWSTPTQDFTSQVTGSSVFDFESDGRAEVLYADEINFYIFDGATGSVLYRIPNSSVTKLEFPTVVDLDNDNAAEIIVTANRTEGGFISGVRVFESADNDWAPTRSIWNQHSYHITNINDDGGIPRDEPPSWLASNTYRLNTFADRDPLLSPDLSVSRLQVTAGTGGQPAAIRVRVGNAGAITSPGPSSVSFYAGDPATGVLLGSVPVPVLAPGAFADLSLDNPPALSTSSDIVAVVDTDNALAECREDNNRLSIPVRLQTRDAAIRVASDATVYPPAAAVQLSARIDNNSPLPGEFRTQLQVEDLNGAVVATFPLRDTGPLDGRAAQTRRETWDSSGFLSGSYRVRGELFSLTGDKLGEATSTFILRHPADQGPAVTLSLQPDRAVYFTRDTARITQRVSNLSQSTLIEAAQLRLSVTDPAGRVIFTATDAVDTLLPDTLLDRIADQRFENLAPGVYAIRGELRASDGSLLANAQARYRVEADTARALRGTVQVQADPLERGRTQLCTDTLSNLGGQPLDAQAIRQLLIRLDSAEALTRNDFTLTLAAGADDRRVRSIDTAELAPGVYHCVLQAQIAGAWRTLASAGFTLVEPPIDIAAGLETGDALRLLVLLDAPDDCSGHPGDDDTSTGHDSDRRGHHGDCEDHRPDRDPDDPAQTPSLRDRRAFLEELLSARGWSYHIVTDATAFTRELRSGGYTTYALFSRRIRLKETVLKELREAVFRGEGLLLTGYTDHRYQALRPALGIQPAGALPAPAALRVEALEDITAGRAGFNPVRPARRLLLAGARAVAHYPNVPDCRYRHAQDGHSAASQDAGQVDGEQADDQALPACDTDAVALSHYRFGGGHSLAAGFDLLARAAQPGADPLFPLLLAQALAATRPAPPVPLLSGSAAALRLTLINQGIATPGQAVITPPPGSRVLDSGQANGQADATLVWPFDLAQDATAALTFWLQLPDAPGPALTDARIQVGQPPALSDYDRLSLRLDPGARPRLADVLDTLTALAARDPAYRKARKLVQQARRRLNRGRAQSALQAALQAADALIRLHRPAAVDAHRQLALAITSIERQL